MNPAPWDTSAATGGTTAALGLASTSPIGSPEAVHPAAESATTQPLHTQIRRVFIELSSGLVVKRVRVTGVVAMPSGISVGIPGWMGIGCVGPAQRRDVGLCR